MEARVYLKNVHITPKKLRYLLPEIKKMTPSQSLHHLFYSPKKGARVFHKAIKSAIDNAKYTLKVSEDLLKFKLFIVEQGNVLKRFRPGGRGTAKPYKKRYSHIKIVLEAIQGKSKVKEVAKKTDPQIVKSKVEDKKLKIDSDKKRVKTASVVKQDAIKK
ncbi:hypothetical protein A2334_05040 [Candidatus Roizmanbacteria bacterium RIFOXYB2_FULL_38_10]|uniref:50S ribosomal protein L22 n=1 Tax=Candidatus Roizmanbacteria bacterium RIFOXYD1_FULL_38_12 TaxID=1802093 RepID=A0A1F7KZR3_9BACT|nr:MAG: hypothetical protein A3K47_01140 [Candidatus Roizmanbacteria bacterium RIFOXYA2_FULL_38_14]OGK63389.1 MAG: hypothetical protein A3K27_01140 [Candidatus Roizmanbacteria bacterium RIFOXYA1_FULL_37_12]OGK65235.1 MAG: hypothetical protein A3K38_01140 [Candidatus Roizmanbacteria bacterium RIFOXYB1_FULL_40_23]OGK68788.1 MAG: hypothetical protein A2334_05040 [Candidatus Roizmanbacteria bacterium RIFOXYB2_FULL_38_10]OGK69640.1 MAG: hypothetical protein A3K21_01145 [Candidatus Roizmanbacteria ba